MASSTSISDTLTAFFKKLPNSINGNGQNFIYLLKDMMSNLTSELNDKFEEISKIANAVTDTPDTTTQQLKNCKLQEVRVGTAISFVLTWDYSAVENYESSEIYIQETEGTAGSVIDWTKVDVARQIRTTKTDTYTVDGINAGYVYKIRFQGKNNLGTVSEEDGNPTLTYAVSAMNNSPDPATNFSCYFNRDGVLWSWRQPVGVDYAYSELRTDSNVGNATGLLEITQDTQSSVLPPTREGVAYLYNKGYGDKYSTAVTCNYSKPVPAAPESITATSTYQGLQFEYSEIPSDCIGICISVNGKKHYTKDDKFNYYCSTGSYTYKACFYDCFGEGTYSAEQTLGTLEEIPPDAVHITTKTVFDDGVIIGKYIGDKEIVGTKIQDDTITTGNLAAGCVTANELASNSVTSDKILAGAVVSDSIAANAITTAKISAGAVTADSLSSSSVTAAKLAANEIDMAGALKIVGGTVTLDENGLTTKCSNGSSVKFNSNGMTFVDSNKNSFAGIGRFCTGTATDGQYVKFTNAWDITPSVIVIPMEIQTSDSSYEHVNIYQRIYPYNISTSGFNIRCQSILGSGSSSSTVSTNQQLWYVDARNTGYYVKSNTDWRTDGSYTYTYLNSITHLTFTLSWSKSDILDSDNSPYRSAYGDTYLSVTTSAGNTVNFGKIFSFSDGGYDQYSQTIVKNGPYSGTWSGGMDVPQGGNMTFKFYTISHDSAYGDYMNGREYTQTVTLTAISYSTSGETVLKQGKVAFIATDSNSVNYSVS